MRNQNQATGMQLARPEDIKADNSRDLLRELERVNTKRLHDEHKARTRQKMRQDAEVKLMDKYIAKAKTYYAKVWKKCGQSPTGHAFRRIDTYGYSLDLCDLCSFVSIPKNTVSYEKSGKKAKAESYRDDQYRTLAQRLMELDAENDVITLPEDDHYRGKERVRKSVFSKSK